MARRVPRHRGITFSQRGRGLSPLGLFGPKTRSSQFQDDGMVDQPVDRGCRGHGIAEVFILPPFWNASYAKHVGHSRAVKRFQGV